jgi:hypothetical protein
VSAAATIAALACLLAMSWLVGRALLVLAGTWQLRGLEVAFGLSLLLGVAVLGIRLPGHGTTTAILLVAVTLAAAWLARRELTPPDFGSLVAAGIVALATILPFAAQGRFGILGVSMLDDIGFHYAFADSLRLNLHLPLAGEVNSYPIAPHALAAGLVTLLHTDDPAVFTALMMTIAIGTAMVASKALKEAPVPLRGLGGAAAGFGFLLAAYYGQSGFKETLVALLLLTIVVALDQLAETRAWRPASVALLGLPAGAALGTYGAPAGAWLAGTGGLWLVAAAIAARRRPGRADVRRLVVLAAGAVGVALAMSLPQIDRLIAFNAVQNVNMGVDPKTFMGNMVGFLPLRTALGIWPAGDFRLPPTELDTTTIDLLGIGVAIGLVAALIGDARRRRFGVIAGLLAALAVYLVTRRSEGPYVTAKTTVIVAPFAATLLLRWLFAARRGALRVAATAAGVAAAGLMLWSSSLALRTTPVGSLYQALDLRTFDSAIKGRRVLFIGFDNYASWELIGARVAMVSPNTVQPSFPVGLRPNKPIARDTPVDPDAVTSDTLRRTDLAITSAAGFGSRLAGQWKLVRHASMYTLWQRIGPVPDKRILDEGGAPGSKLQCRGSSPTIGAAARALVLPEPVVGTGETWTTSAGSIIAGAGGFAPVGAGGTVQQALALAPGEWDLSLQYAGSREIRISAPGLSRVLPPNLVASGAMWPVGTIRSGTGSTVVSVTVGADAEFGRPATDAIGAITATRRGGDRTVVAIAACGQYLDGYLVR